MKATFTRGDLVLYVGADMSSIFEVEAVLPDKGRVIARKGTAYYATGKIRGNASHYNYNYPMMSCRKATAEETIWYANLYAI